MDIFRFFDRAPTRRMSVQILVTAIGLLLAPSIVRADARDVLNGEWEHSKEICDRGGVHHRMRVKGAVLEHSGSWSNFRDLISSVQGNVITLNNDSGQQIIIVDANTIKWTGTDATNVRCSQAMNAQKPAQTPPPKSPPRPLPAPGERFKRDDKVVLDTATGLTWQASDSYSERDWNAARSHCASLSPGTWTLPSIKELQNLAGPDNDYAGVESRIFNFSGYGHWSAEREGSEKAWAVIWYVGQYSYPISHETHLRALCVRRSP